MNGENSQTSRDALGSWRFEPSDAISSQRASMTKNKISNIGAETQASPASNHDSRSLKNNHSVHDKVISWSASEFIAHQKSFGWYALLTFATVVGATLIYFLTKDKISTVAVVFVAVFLGITAARSPRTLDYKLDDYGLTVGHKSYGYNQFRSFAVVDEGVFSSISLMPMKRFMPLTTIYYEPKDEDKIVGILSDRLPIETHKLDLIDQFMRRIRY